jgi:hypothetical protein
MSLRRLQAADDHATSLGCRLAVSSAGQRQLEIADLAGQVCRTHCSTAQESAADARSDFPGEPCRALGSAGVLGDGLLFAAEVARAMAARAVLVWSNALGDGAPFYVPVEVLAADRPRMKGCPGAAR